MVYSGVASAPIWYNSPVSISSEFFRAFVLFLLVFDTQSRIKERCMRFVEIAQCLAICSSYPLRVCVSQLHSDGLVSRLVAYGFRVRYSMVPDPFT